MTTNFRKVQEFHEKMGLLVNESPVIPEGKTFKLRKKLILEEWRELKHEMRLADEHGYNDCLELIAKEMADLLYVIYGAGLAYGIDLDYVFEKVHESNMSKLGSNGKPLHNKDGKVIKGPNYTPPNMSEVIETLKKENLTNKPE